MIRNCSKLDKIYKSVLKHKFEDIVVIDTKKETSPKYLIVATAFNHRHLVSGTESVNKDYKESGQLARLSISESWNVIDFETIILHLFSKKCRQHYDVEQLWAVGEKYDDHSSKFSPEFSILERN